MNELGQWRLSDSDLLYWANIVDVKADIRQQLVDWQREDWVMAYVLELNSEVVGYGELWKDDNEVELARLLVKPGFRGKGLGGSLVRELLTEAKTLSRKICLRVHPANSSAIDLYLRCGFSIVNEALQKEYNSNQPIQFVWMELPA